MEYAVRTGRDGLIAEYTSRADDADRERQLLHCTHLNRRGVGTEQNRIVAGSYKESVLHIAGRVLRWEVKCLENVIVILDLRPFCDIVAELAENLDDFLPDDGNRVAGAESYRVSGKSAVER